MPASRLLGTIEGAGKRQGTLPASGLWWRRPVVDLLSPSGAGFVVTMDVVCGVILDSSGRMLACLRPPGKVLAGLWEFPGGKVDPDESPEEALVRELREELAIDVEVGVALSPVRWSYPWAEIRLMPFRCRVIDGIPRALEHEELRWCDADESRRLDWVPADLPVLAELGFAGSAG